MSNESPITDVATLDSPTKMRAGVQLESTCDRCQRHRHVVISLLGSAARPGDQWPLDTRARVVDVAHTLSLLANVGTWLVLTGS